MTANDPRPSREDVLDAFAVEPDSGRDTLEQYLRNYPQYAVDLVDLSRELSRVIVEDHVPLPAEHQSLIKAAWRKHKEAASARIADPFAALSMDELRELAKRLEVPRQLITAFREHKVIVASVPRRFLERFSSALGCTFELFCDTLRLPSAPSHARSYKANDKPGSGTAATFEQLLVDAGVPEEKRALLMESDD